MFDPRDISSRRGFLGATAFGALGLAAWTTPGVFAEELIKTAKQTEGPFYPDKLPLDTDNDLIVVNDGITPAVGTIAHLTGKVLDAKGNPLKGAVVEIWQCDGNGVYLHSDDSTQKKDKQDSHFQGFGRFLTGKDGSYYFRTIKPVAYPGRTPHIHVKVKLGKKELLVTQLYVKGEKQNERDGIYNSVKDAKQREQITLDYTAVPKSKIGELAADSLLVLGYTPELD
jgi:protocatechuate 3,4-dioxygenase beta subunit